MTDTDILLVETFKNGYATLQKHLIKYYDKLAFREECHDTDFGIENSLEIIVSRLINENNYGIVFTLIIKKQKADELKCVELSVLKGDGSFIESRDFWFRHNETETDTLMKDFNFVMGLYCKKIIETLENENMT